MLNEAIANLTLNDDALIIEWSDGYRSPFHYLWLRDNCTSPKSRHPNGQRIQETASIPLNIHPSSARITEDGAVELIWSHDGHISVFSAAWLRGHDYSRAEKVTKQDSIKLWDAKLNSALPILSYKDVSTNKEALRNWLTMVCDYGFAILQDIPVKSGMLTEVVELFGYVRETNYGRYFDLKSVPDPSNLAYTGLPLSPHTDNPYRYPIPTLELFYCLSSSVDGGTSILVDGFAVAEALRHYEPDKFKLLSTLPLRFRFSDKDNDLMSKGPAIGLDLEGNIEIIRFHHRCTMPFQFAPDMMKPYYEAYQTFSRMVNEPERQVRFKLQPGDLFMVDNERVLHARTGFSGTRHLQGCYADKDGLHSCLRVLEKRTTT